MSKLGLLGRAVGSLISLVTRIVFWFVQNTSLAVSLSLTVYTIGEYTHRFLQDKPKGKTYWSFQAIMGRWHTLCDPEHSLPVKDGF
jgi:hypothetical protein